jgi:hypothetical protein
MLPLPAVITEVSAMALPAVMKKRQIQVLDARTSVANALRELDTLSRLNDGKHLSIDPKIIQDAKQSLGNLRRGLPSSDDEFIVQTRKSDQVILTSLTGAFFIAGIINLIDYWPHIRLLLLGKPDAYASESIFIENLVGIAFCVFVFPPIMFLLWRYSWGPQRMKEAREREHERRILRLTESLEVAALQYQTPVFACRGDFERCKVRQSSLWCHVTLLICLLHALIPRIEAKINV